MKWTEVATLAPLNQRLKMRRGNRSPEERGASSVSTFHVCQSELVLAALAPPHA
jgi:hypothetical protein